ncbi:MAG: cytochrome c, partial [Planctomycetaceae bacterium]
RRVGQLIDFYGIPKQGATLGLVRNDPEIQGPRLFLRNCASCHSYQPDNAATVALPGPSREHLEHGDLGAPNLYGFGSRAWLTGLLNPERIIDEDYFGATAHAQQVDGSFKSGGMVEYVCDTMVNLSKDQATQLKDLIATLSAEANLPRQSQEDAKARSTGQLERGRTALINEFSCSDCHKFHDEGDLGTAPDLTGYASAEWLRKFISNPSHERFYPATDPTEPAANDRMPAFARFTDASKNQLNDNEIEMLVLWLRSDKQDLKQWEQGRSAAAAYESDPVSQAGTDQP